MMTDSKNPLTAPVYELEDIEYDIRVLAGLLNDQIELAHTDKDIINLSHTNYLVTLLLKQSHRLTGLHNELFEAWKVTKPLIETSQSNKEGI